ncbi:MAG: type II secretion system GspH family protein [Syntrophales bacterium]|nr:type II secretion system GspH family protein [Syntrophales bacterium]MCK9391051.1 type II secretion system GspH family protein [Syntrophales bacterium]
MCIKRAFQAKSPAPRGKQSHFHIRDRRDIRSQSGFTLIEIIVTLILVGILASMGGMAIVQAVQGYMTVKENSVTTQKAQLAMSRITREIVEMVNIPSTASNTALPLTGVSNCTGTAGTCVRTIGLNSGAVKIAFGDGTTLDQGDILINNVNAFSFTYWSGTTSTTTWPAGSDSTLSAIDVNMQISQPNGAILTFTTRVDPRNNGNIGGAAIPTTPPTVPTTWGINPTCFIATAAYGDPGHPMVQILRDFRDRYLLSWQGGRWFVKKYYEHGPTAADLIRNQPLAMWAVRCLLAPVAALIFCLIYVPLAIPFILIVSLIVTVALFAAVRGGMPSRSGVLRARGSILIGLIITMVIMALLGAAMLPMFSASYANQVYADQGRKAYSLAESGYRYASSKFLWGGTSGWNAAMTELNNKTCNLSGNAGSFKTVLYPLWFSANVTAAGANALETTVYGTVPAEFSSGSCSTSPCGYIAVVINSTNYYYSYTSYSTLGATITFNGLSISAPTAVSLPAITTAGVVDVQPVTKTGTNPGLAKGGNLTISAAGASAFPLLNGNFTLINSAGGQINSGAIFNYTKRVANILYNITLSSPTENANWTSAVSVPASSNVILSKYVRIDSTGTSGSVSRKVTYNVPIGFLTGSGGDFQKQKHPDTMDTTGNWATSQDLGTQALTGGSQSSMYVSGVVGGSSMGGIAGFLGGLLGWSTSGAGWALVANTTTADLAQSWVDAGGCLSYDLQVKMKNTLPYFMTGMSFRMRNNTDSSDLYTYGISFQRQMQSQNCILWSCGSAYNDDGIDDNLRPAATSWTGYTSISWGTGTKHRYSNPVIILWQRNGPATGTGTPPVGTGSFKVLAYRNITSADNLTTGTGTSLVLKPWVTLMVRVIEGYSLPITNGRVTAAGRNLKYGDIIYSGTKTARIIGTPIMTTNWSTSSTGVGTLILSNRPIDSAGSSTPFTSGDYLYLVGGDGSAYARASGAQAMSKANYLMVYYSDNKTPATGNGTQADNTRVGNPLGSFNWPPDDWTDRIAGNDYFSLVGGTTTAIRWTWINPDTTSDVVTFVNALSTTDLYNAVIKTDALLSPAWTAVTPASTTADFLGPNGTTSGDGIALITSSTAPNTAKTTYYDDFDYQLDIKGGTGFLPPIQN